MANEKKYLVAKTYSYFLPSIVEAFSTYEKAKNYADLLCEEKGENYIVMQIL